jgi:chemotaxis protein methyltransferase CheR
MPKFSYDEITSFAKLLESRIGIVVKEDRISQVQTVFEDFFKILGVESFNTGYDLLATLSVNDSRFQVLAEKITIGETFFFRDQMQFHALQEIVLPQLIEHNRLTGKPLSILSAASSTGEEIYSIAILLHELLPVAKEGQIKLIGGDINGASLNKARKATYSKWSFRGVAPSIISKYFFHKDDQYHLSERIKNMVQFQYLNLADPLPFVDIDLILLRNVLIYFNNEFIEKLAGRCFSALRDGGFLLVGTSELNRQNFKLFEEKYIKDAIFYQKKSPDFMNQDLQKPSLFTLNLQSAFKPKLIENKITPPSNSFASLMATTSSKIAKSEDTSSKDIYKKALQHFEAHEFSQAEKLLNQILDKEPQALLLMAKIEANRGKNIESERFCRLYLEKDPDGLEGHYLMSLIYQANNRLDKAAEKLRYTVLLDNSFVIGHLNLALIYQKTDDKQASKRHLLQIKRVLEPYPKDKIVPFSEGQKVARILQIVEEMLSKVR